MVCWALSSVMGDREYIQSFVGEESDKIITKIRPRETEILYFPSNFWDEYVKKYAIGEPFEMIEDKCMFQNFFGNYLKEKICDG
jgi:hypothetical protein